ncbi:MULTISPECIES: Lrp/AsnC family transcriptional regulator [Streptomyces]|uniref:Lrp/AsnC family transcriptional regulator n=1 Tax=Streptomyces lycii TaxID=2654337 RepID=A0ABQ7FJ09_9ACTN|nr:MULTISPECIES: Lrp/AsnC family transcriptional regulator [Streptomyces]KAF4407953.1 Lrp/AsnC family transcriptional regulator [Streptomyces lycii]PGH49535.1 AsnC family transcriptional regulator [Streptomyces sp. Ru87]
MDELDSAIVARLQADARQTNRELARSLGVAPSTCLERVRLLRKRGVINEYTVQVDLPSLNRNVQALVALQVRPLNRQVIEEVRRSMDALDEVLAVYVLTGGDDLIIHVAVPDVDQLHSFLIDRLSDRREIVSFRSSVIFQHDRKLVVPPLP